MFIVLGFALFNAIDTAQVTKPVATASSALKTSNSFGQLFHVKVHPPPAQDRSLRGQHRVDQGVFENQKNSVGPNGSEMSILYVDCLKLLSVILLIKVTTADKIVKSPQTIRSVNYEDFSLLCADGIPLLMEDHKPRPCQPRPWLKEQKCPTGFWCHEGQSEQSFYCCPSSRKFANRCHLPPAVGYGKQRMRRFYFDWKTDACHELQYSGIGGNENSFMEYENCEQVCRGAGEPPILLPSNMKVLPKEPTKETKKIEKPEKDKKMVYPKEVAAPVSLQPPTVKTTTSDGAYEAFYTVPPKTSSTSTFPPTIVLSTTASTTRSTTTEAEIPEVFDPNPCVLSPDKGFPGSVAVNMWYYDPSSTTCSPFMYLGKGGNSNRFETSEECLETCGIGKPTRKSCELPPAIGNGPFNIPRFYFDRVTKKCERFFYSGRDGNDNRFYKKNKCERLCLRKKTKKKENIYEFTTTPSTPPVIYESTPMRIIQNLIPSKTRAQTTSTSAPSTETRMNTDPYVYATPTPQVHITVEPWIERFTEKSIIYEHSTTPHPTLIYEPRGETLPTIVPPSTTTPSIVDHVFSSLMNTQQQKLVEFVQPPIVQKPETPRKFSSHESGNMNNFLTRNDCVKTCQSPVPSPTSQCSQQAASGHGEQYLSRYFFSPEYRQCLHFIYSGDGGNQNNFESLTDCLETCVANGIKFSSLANSPMSPVPPPPTPLPTLLPSPSVTSFQIKPRNVCPQGDPLITVDGTPIQCDPSKAAKCPGDHVCTPRGNEAYCCPSPMNFCLQSRPPISVCSGPDFEPVREIRFTYDPMADRCVRFSFQNCRGAAFSPSGSLNNFVSNSQCNRLCCNQGYNLVYKRRLLMAMNDDPIVDEE
ncbi:hypothetical protein CAEBREN_25810 [Caenorhabditis brenneri]|uniref:BPTI/Kunitz inhibitor domain-containing protein n=1 Tax=Caenorhabditis brenneri TaxID=135651 RepID=G0NPP4_CAEBE|nr:hypothetical protein CAEBREN_25810 [Caenorhabditis brenneri]